MVRESLDTHRRCEMLDITKRIEQHIQRLGVADGMVIVQAPHTTAGITVNENADSDVQHDLLEKLSILVPKTESFYRHDEGNSDSHLKSSLIGCTQSLIIEGGKLALGTWQGVYFCEFDGPRSREFWLKFVRFD